MKSSDQPRRFDGSPKLPEGLKYQADMFTADEERQPGPHIEKLPLQEVTFRSFADEN